MVSGSPMRGVSDFISIGEVFTKGVAGNPLQFVRVITNMKMENHIFIVFMEISLPCSSRGIPIGVFHHYTLPFIASRLEIIILIVSILPVCIERFH